MENRIIMGIALLFTAAQKIAVETKANAGGCAPLELNLLETNSGGVWEAQTCREPVRDFRHSG